MPPTFAEPEIVTGPERYIAAIARDFTMDTRDQIPALWGELWQHDFELDGLNMKEAFGASFSVSENSFRYGAGYEVSDPNVKPAGGCVITLAGGTYARFSGRLKMMHIPDLFNHAFGTWLPNSGREQAEGSVFEYYPDDPEATEDNRLFELWIPIKA